MFTAIYRFKVKTGFEERFLQSWRELTKLLIKHEGGLGSRLHKSVEENVFIAYAQWPNREMWEKQPKSNLPESANEIRNQMRESCSEIVTIHELEVIEDLLVKQDN